MNGTLVNEKLIEAYPVDNCYYVEATAPPASAYNPPLQSNSLDSKFLWMVNEPPLNPNGLKNYLISQSWTPGMIEEFKNNLKNIPMRYFVYDDSGSMTTNDGKKKIGRGRYIDCSRWNELCTVMDFQYSACYYGNIRSKFVFLNNRVPYESCDQMWDMNTLTEMKSMSGGGTPLCRVISKIVNEIESYVVGLRQLGKKVVVSIATDGIPDDGDITKVLRRFKDLPVYLILRLCTDEEKIVKFWNEIDKELELNLDVLDDYVSEATEVYEHNPSICYSESLHQFREFGTKSKEMDMLDEQKLSVEQLINLGKIIYSVNFIGNYRVDNSVISRFESEIYKPYCPVTRRVRNYIVFHSPSSCTIC